QFHAVIGGIGFAAGNFFFGLAMPQQCRPAAGSGVAEAGPVRVYFHLLHLSPIPEPIRSYNLQPTLMPGRKLVARALLRNGVNVASRCRKTNRLTARKPSV